jgi:DDE superfamily endonuclease
VSASGKVTPPVLIIPAKIHMNSWYHESLHGTELILLSESGYTNDELGLQWLKHFILHTESSKDSKPKVLLMDSHASHRTPEFTILAHDNNIYPYTFPSHLTHILQPLDVGIFQPYKHWHQEAVHASIRNLNLDYNISSFLRDLPEIRSQTFKELLLLTLLQKLEFGQ